MSMFAMNVKKKKKNVYIRISYLVLDYDEHIHNISHNRNRDNRWKFVVVKIVHTLVYCIFTF